MNLEQILSAPEENLAIGVLRQAVHDLRRFRKAGGNVERELYGDAYGWITASDFSWPYSFVNVCKLLDVPPEMLRAELLADASLGLVSYWCKLGARYGRTFGASLTRTFNNARNGHAAPPPAPVYSLHHS